MKRIGMIIALLVWGIGAMAQEPLLTIDETNTGIDSLQLQQASEMLQRGERNGELVLSIGGQHITLGKAKQSKIAAQSTTNVNIRRHQFSFGITAFEFGYNLLSGLSYDNYTPQEEGFMDLKVEKSIHVGWRIFDFEFFLNRNQNLSFITGLYCSWDNYRFYNEWSIEKQGDRIVPIALEGKKKSKLTTAQIGIPLGLKYRPARKIELTAFVYGELMTNPYTKVTKPKEKADMRGLNHLRFGVEATATYHNIGVYVKYNLTPLFRSGIGPECYPLSVGLAWGF